MSSSYVRFLALLTLFVCMPGWGQNTGQPAGGDFATPKGPLKKVPEGVIIVKGAWSSASDSVTPLPEDGSISNSKFSDSYFGMTYNLPPEWGQKHTGPPPSDTGRYVLAQAIPMGAA